MGFRGGGQIDPPQHILVFKYPIRDRVKNYSIIINMHLADIPANFRLSWDGSFVLKTTKKKKRKREMIDYKNCVFFSKTIVFPFSLNG